MVTSCYVECEPRAAQACPRCRKDITYGPQGGVGKVWFCRDCYDEIQPKRLARMGANMKRDRLEVYGEKIRQAMKELAELKKNNEAYRESIRRDVEIAAIESVRRLSLWKRFVMLFNPFSVAVPPSGACHET